jgi:hypothetical protein
MSLAKKVHGVGADEEEQIGREPVTADYVPKPAKEDLLAAPEVVWAPKIQLHQTLSPWLYLALKASGGSRVIGTRDVYELP